MPAEHATVAVLPVGAYLLLRRRRLPAGDLVVVLLFASQLPDLIDKPLAWIFGVIPSGRMVAHSIVVATPVILSVLVVTRRLDRLGHGVAFGWGYLSHVAGDFAPVYALGTDYYYFPNLLWPLLSANPDRSSGMGDHVPGLLFDSGLEVAVIVGLLSYVVLDLHRQRTAARETS